MTLASGASWLFAALTLLSAAPDVPHATPSPRAAHPLDGPDVDLRVQVTASKVTLHAIFNLAFLDELMPMVREDEYALAVPEQPALRERMFAWLKLNSTLSIDGVAVTPTLAAFDVDPGDPRWLPMFPTMGSKALIKARFELEYKALQAPRTVSLVWKAYPPSLVMSTPERKVFNEVLTLLTAGGTEQVIPLRHDEPEFTWHAPADGTAVRLLPVPMPVREYPVSLSTPTIVGLLFALAAVTWGVLRARWLRPARVVLASLAILGAAVAYRQFEPWLRGRTELPTAQEAVAIFAPLHANVYRAFDYTEPAEVYDALARSVDGSLLDTVYNDVYRSLVMAEEGGAVSRVKEVRPMQHDIERVGVLGDGRTPSFTVNARWQVDGAVFHWGHQHWRTNEHRARYTVIATEAGWRIAGAEPLAQERVESGPGFEKPAATEGRK